MNLKEICKTRILGEMLRAVQPESGWKVLIVDDESVKIISAACRMYDIIEEGVTLVEKITVPRQPLPALEAIYLLSPSEASIRGLKADFDKEKPQYKAAHIFFTNKLTDHLFHMLSASTKLSAKIRTLKELNLDFIAFESRVFHFNRRETLRLLFSSETDREAIQAEVEALASKLATVMSTIGELRPFIRYSTTHPVTEQVARVFGEKLLAAARSAPSSSKASARSSGKLAAVETTVLILDRSYDVVSPLMHEFTYQAMIFDLLAGKLTSGDHYKFSYSTGAGKSEVSEAAINDESDEFWVELRHKHIQKAIEWLTESFNEFAKSNKALQLSQGKGKEVHKLTDMAAALRAMPEAQELSEKYSLHMSLCSDCMDAFDKGHCEALALLEQAMATGEDEDGRKFKNAMAALTKLLMRAKGEGEEPPFDPPINEYDKARLLMLYFATQTGVSAKDQQRLFEYANLSRNMQRALTNLYYLGVTHDKKTDEEKKKKKKRTSGDDEQYTISRYVPPLKDILLAGDKLSLKHYPYLEKFAKQQNAEATGSSSGKSSKSRRPTRESKGKEVASSNASKGPRLVVFIIGGAAYNELRVGYEAAREGGVNVLIGSNCIMTPVEFVELVRDLKSDSDMVSLTEPATGVDV